MAEHTGEVKWFNNAKGYGFLGRPEGPDVFVHYSAIRTEGYKSLKENDKVTFNIVQDQEGKFLASDVERIKDAHLLSSGTAQS